ncbi:TPA: hypothetical protein ACG3NN_002430, partial [Legionella pneumophila]
IKIAIKNVFIFLSCDKVPSLIYSSKFQKITVKIRKKKQLDNVFFVAKRDSGCLKNNLHRASNIKTN